MLGVVTRTTPNSQLKSISTNAQWPAVPEFQIARDL